MSAFLDPTRPATRKTLEILRDLIEERLGMHFSDQNLGLLGDRLAARVAHYELTSFLDYYYLLKYDPEGEAEWPAVSAAVTVNETYFWREPDALEVAARELVPELQA